MMLSTRFVSRFGFIVFFVVSAFGMSAQLTVTNATNANEAVQTYLLGEGVVATNITFTGNNDQIASFLCNGCNLNLASGVVMSSGNANGASGPNSTGAQSQAYNAPSTDPDLDAISAVTVNDACILQFDFVPTGDSLVFSYVFGSDEYPNFINSNFNDSFGFFLSGPGISGPYQNNAINIAQIPNTTLPVSINNLNNGTTGTNGPCEYCQYYIHNGNGGEAPYNGSNTYINADGFTTVLQAFANVICGETYHIKLAIADGGDSSYDSWVFLEAGSFESNTLDLSFSQPGLAPTDFSMYEGCDGQSILFTRPPGATGDLSFEIAYTGTAQNGVDYELLPSSIDMPDGVDTVIVPINGIADGLTEGTETIILTVDAGVACANNISLSLEIYELSPLSITFDNQSSGCGDSVVLNPIITGGYGEYGVTWEGYGTGYPFTIQTDQDITVNYTVTDVCAVQSVSGSITINQQTFDPITINAIPDAQLSCGDILTANTSVTGGNGAYSYSWNAGGTEISTAPALSWNTPVTGEVVLIITDGCGNSGTTSFDVSFNNPPIVVDLGGDQNLNCLELATIVPSVSGGTGNYNYAWFVDGSIYSNATSITLPPTGTTSVELNVTDECGGLGNNSIAVNLVATPVVITTDNTLNANCLSSITIDPQVSGGDGNLYYAWDVNGNLTFNDTWTGNVIGDFTVNLLVSDDCGNFDNEEITVTMNASNLAVNITANDNDICPGDQVTVTASVTGAAGTPAYDWSNGGSNATINVSPSSSTTYSISVTDDCNFTATDEITVDVLTQEFPLTTENVTICFGVYAPNVAQGGYLPYTYEYANDSLNYDDNDFSGIYNGTYQITVTDFCGYESTFTLISESCDMIIPNIFTPDGDDRNDYFYISGLEGYPGSTLYVYNRWGNKVFEDQDYRNKWDGDELESGTYYYVLDRVDGQSFSGNVMLLRK